MRSDQSVELNATCGKVLIPSDYLAFNIVSDDRRQEPERVARGGSCLIFYFGGFPHGVVRC